MKNTKRYNFKKSATSGAFILALAAPMAAPLATAPAAHAASTTAADGTPVFTQGTNNGFIDVKVTPAEEAKLRASIIAKAASQAGVPYVWGASNPGVGFDCSGLNTWVYKQHGITLPRTVATQRPVVRTVSEANVKPGDLVFSGFTADKKKHTHVGIVVDPVKKTFWHAPQTGDVVRLSSYAGTWYKGSTFGSVITPTQDTTVTPLPGTSNSTTPNPNTPTTGTGGVVVTTPGGSTIPSTSVNTSPLKTYATTSRFVKAGTTLNVRSGSSASTKSVGVVKGGTLLTGQPLSNGWYKITTGSFAGKYVSNSYLATPKVKAGVKLNVRSAASATSKSVGTVKGGTMLTGIAQGSWYKITSGTYANRYVSKAYLSA